ncbi:hypothetical protein M426DRAFT_7581 [Hypoxylon sp. CI-4A]|nr:hypothetical protein M426DRAFT_7581 [Hypoxylon sp. CI-4A]
MVPSRLKRNSQGQHKIAASLDTSHLIVLPSGSPHRPASSSGVPHIDTRLSLSVPASGTRPSQLPSSRDSTKHFRTGSEQGMLVSQVTVAMESLEMGPPHRGERSHGNSGTGDYVLGDNSSMKRNKSTTELPTRKVKDGKHRWLSQLKGWVSVSEPSAQALKQHKKETYKKAHVALDDPQANAKLHAPIGAIPVDAIKPGGRGPSPEEIAMKQSEQRKRLRHSDTRIGGLSQGSGSGSSRYSTSSGFVFNTMGVDVSK